MTPERLGRDLGVGSPGPIEPGARGLAWGPCIGPVIHRGSFICGVEDEYGDGAAPVALPSGLSCRMDWAFVHRAMIGVKRQGPMGRA